MEGRVRSCSCEFSGPTSAELSRVGACQTSEPVPLALCVTNFALQDKVPAARAVATAAKRPKGQVRDDAGRFEPRSAELAHIKVSDESGRILNDLSHTTPLP